MIWRPADLSECYGNTIKAMDLNDLEAYRRIRMLGKYDVNNKVG